jgi:hypothetical protein
MLVVVVTGMMGVAYAKTDSAQTQCDSDSHNRLDLKLSDQNESWRDGVTATWVVSNMAPGTDYAFEGSFIGLKSNVKGNIGIDCDYSVNEEVPPVESDTDPHTNLFPDKMAKELIITRALYKISFWQIDLLTGEPQGMSWKDRRSYCEGRYFRWRIQDVDHDDRITFYDLRQMPVNGLPLPASTGEGARFLMSVRFAETAGNDLQGDTFDLTMLYTLKPW